MYVLFLFITFLPTFSYQIDNDFQTICRAGIRQDNTNYIHCGHKELTEIPNFTRITNKFYGELVLRDNQIIEIATNAFQGLRVRRLNLSGNKIRSLSSHAFIELSNYLEELTIEFDGNYVRDIPDAIKTNLMNLRSLELINLNLVEIKNHSFSKFRKLERLSITNSSIRTIDSDAFASLNNLRYLNLEKNSLNDSSWNSLTHHLPHLEELYLTQNNFHYLKRTPLNHLKVLDLSFNGLQYIDTNIFHSLERLHLQNNEINSLQLTFLISLKYLKELNLSFNRLTFLPENIFQMNSNLSNLLLQGNDLNYLTNYSFFGLNNLLDLNLARNRLQFLLNHQPFQHLSSLKVLNLDRNAQMNITKSILQDLSLTLNELSLQNCNLTKFDFSLEYLINLQRLKLSSNYLTELPKNFLPPTLIFVDLQKNSFTEIPNLSDHQLPNLLNLELSSNQISHINQHDLSKYPKLKTIGLTANPLICDCHLQWIKRWLIENYDPDVINILPWTCTRPMHLSGKRLIVIDEQDMLCDEQETLAETTSLSSEVQSTSIRSTTILEPPTNELIIKDIKLNSDSILTIEWEYMSTSLPKYYHIKIYNRNHHQMIYQHSIDGRQRSIDIDISHYIERHPAIYVVCIGIEDKRYCRSIFLKLKSTSPILSTMKNDTEQFIYLLAGMLVGAILICTILIIICYYRLRRYSKENLLSTISTANSDEKKSLKTICYHPLNIIGYPQQQSSNTSECSLHSSVDVNHLTNDTYHIYQRIPSVHNSHQYYTTRTHILI